MVLDTILFWLRCASQHSLESLQFFGDHSRLSLPTEEFFLDSGLTTEYSRQAGDPRLLRHQIKNNPMQCEYLPVLVKPSEGDIWLPVIEGWGRTGDGGRALD